MASTRVRILLIAFALIAVPYGGCSLMNRNLQRESLPTKLKTGWFYAEGSCNTFLSYQGAFAFSLQQDTIDTIKEQGIGYFNDIRDEQNGPIRHYFSSEKWRETPVSDVAMERGTLMNLYCGKQHSWLWPSGIEGALKRPGSFYTDTGARGILVIPSLGLVAASASDR